MPDHAMAGQGGHSSAHVEPFAFVAAHPGGGSGRAGFRRAVVGFAGAALVVAAVLAAATVNQEGRSAALRTVLKEQGDPSDVAAHIIASAKGFNREVDDLVPHDDPKSPVDTRLESNYPQLAESIVKHGSGILYRLIHGKPDEPQAEGIPMPVDDEEPPDADGMDADAGGELPQTTPAPDPSADQGSVAEAIIQDSNRAREENLAQADTNGLSFPMFTVNRTNRQLLSTAARTYSTRTCLQQVKVLLCVNPSIRQLLNSCLLLNSNLPFAPSCVALSCIARHPCAVGFTCSSLQLGLDAP